MDRISTWLKKLLFPGGKLVFLLAVLGAVSLYLAFGTRLSSFGGSYPYEKLMTASTAGGVWTIVFCMAVYMVIHSGKQRNRSKPTS